MTYEQDNLADNSEDEKRIKKALDKTRRKPKPPGLMLLLLLLLLMLAVMTGSFFEVMRLLALSWNKLTKFYLLYFFYFLCVILYSLRIRRKIFFIRTSVWGRMKTNFLSFRGHSFACAFFRFAYLDRNFLHLLIMGYCSLSDRVFKEVVYKDCSPWVSGLR